MADEATLDRIRQLRAGGERGRAMALAIENKVLPSEAPFLDGYQETLDSNGISFEPAVVAAPKAKK